jgi:hypothetical protein
MNRRAAHNLSHPHLPLLKHILQLVQIQRQTGSNTHQPQSRCLLPQELHCLRLELNDLGTVEPLKGVEDEPATVASGLEDGRETGVIIFDGKALQDRLKMIKWLAKAKHYQYVGV